jgi:uncharacterized protein (DUF885 family)
MDGANEAARDLADRYWEALLDESPILGTHIGDERFDDRMPDVGEATLAERRSVHERALEEAAAIDRSGLDETMRTSLDILDAVAAREVEAFDLRFDRLTAVTHMMGPGMFLALIGSIQRADTAERVDAYVGRLREVPRWLAQLGEVADGAVEAGQVSPALVVDRSISQVERLLALDPAASPGMAPAAGASDEDRARVAEVLRDEVWPAYAGYLETLRRYRPNARDSIGLVGLPNGEELYAAAIHSFCTLPLDARELHQVGLDELEAIEEERAEIASRLGYAGWREALDARIAAGENGFGSREEIVELAERQVARSWEAAPAWFGRIPDDNCEVRAVEEFREADTPPAHYMAPSADGTRRGVYYINTYEPAERQRHALASIAYHEANPGHHFQIALDIGHAERPPLRRFGGILVGSAFAEGWGLYSERLADEMGLYEDEWERLGMLDAQAWRAVRLVVDTGIHALGWERQRAIDLMITGGGSTKTDAEIEVDRYIAWPGQALSYKVGQREIQRWRAEASQREGSAFDVKRFHDRVLELGSLPLAALDRELRAED